MHIGAKGVLESIETIDWDSIVVPLGEPADVVKGNDCTLVLPISATYILLLVTK